MSRTCAGVVRIEQAHDHGVDGDRFARSGGAGDEHVGHGGQVGGDDAAVDVFAHGEGEARLGLGEGFGFEHVAQVDGFALVVRHLDADGALAGHALDEDALGAHGEAEVFGEAGDAAVFDAGFGLELVGGDHGAGIDLRPTWPRTSNSAHFSTSTRASSRSSSSRTTWGPSPELSRVLGGSLNPLTFLGATVTVRSSASARSWMAMLLDADAGRGRRGRCWRRGR